MIIRDCTKNPFMHEDLFHMPGYSDQRCLRRVIHTFPSSQVESICKLDLFGVLVLIVD